MRMQQSFSAQAETSSEGGRKGRGAAGNAGPGGSSQDERKERKARAVRQRARVSKGLVGERESIIVTGLQEGGRNAVLRFRTPAADSGTRSEKTTGLQTCRWSG
jgi:hypothetical protein